MRLFTLLLTGLLTLSFAGAADARPRRRDRGDLVAQRPGAPGERREKARQRVKAMRAMILADELELDEATSARLAPVLDRFDDELIKLLAERVKLRGELRGAHDAGDDRRIGELIDKLVANQDARWDSERRRFAEVRRLLSPRQAARLLDVLPEIDRRIMKALRDRRAGRPAP